ncbi:threonine 3-dehydrogenase [Nitrospina gracilis]|uniref:zinc-binding dehydrogenase n=1 Tax=Nitrospina TaxID=35800 RepID=UPI000349D7B6|nr:zinc-binding dehydrogenase [Nitrospina gracilis]MCF8723786.1 threonine 3-dehydrogenase [Nitrospina sp. Nb-3]
MKALILDIQKKDWETTRGMTFTDVSEPSLDERKNPDDGGKVIIKPRFAGFCGTDKGIWFRKSFRDMIFDSLHRDGQHYRIMGHELLGEVVEAGSYAAKQYGYKAGDTVSTESHIFCGRCHQCKIGDQHVCADHLIIGISTDGCFADYIKLPAKGLWRVDTDRIRPEVAAIQDPLGNAVHACSRVDLRGRTVAIFGCGTIGLFTILVARAMGATHIIGVDPNAKNLKLAGRLGVDLTLPVDKTVEEGEVGPDADIVARIRDDCFGAGVDVAFEMSGSNRALNTALSATRTGGDVILFGLSAGDFTLTDYQQIVMHGKTLHGVVGREVFQTWYTMSNLLMSKGHDLQDKIYDVILNRGEGTLFPFHSFDRNAFETAIQEHPKIIFRF